MPRGRMGVVLALAVATTGAPAAAQEVQYRAFQGPGFGVGHIAVALPPGADRTLWDVAGYRIEDSQGRVVYPAFTVDRGAGRLRRLLGRDGRALSCYFLFRGDQPLEVTLLAPDPIRVEIPCEEDPEGYQRELHSWWLRYTAALRQHQDATSNPPILETYLAEMLSRRLDLAPPFGPTWRDPQRPSTSIPRQVLELLAGTEDLRTRWLQLVLRGQADMEPADQPLPPSIRWTDWELPPPEGSVEVEPIAGQVPAECFYVRFGRYNNYLWLRDMLETHAADLAVLISGRGHDAGVTQRIERQLGLGDTLLSRLLGETAISDMAVIGHDLFLEEGAAIGVLFEARNAALLDSNLRQQRAKAAEAFAEDEPFERELEVAGHPVHWRGTPDNRFRSFYVVHDRYHLVSNSMALVRRFLEVADEGGSLAELPEFRWARSAAPPSGDQTAFVYFSSPFQENLLSAPYQIELHRRLRSLTDMQLLAMARWVAQAEGLEAESPGELVEAGLLPPSVLARPDQGELQLEPDRWVDSLRGARGTFLPISDVPMEQVTRAESEWYGALRRYVQRHWTRMDPVQLLLRRESIDDSNLTRLSIDARMLPFEKDKYGTFTSLFGRPTTRWVATDPQDIISVQAFLQGGVFVPNVGPHHLFLGVRDLPPRGSLPAGPVLRAIQMIRITPAYLGAWPNPGLLDLIPVTREVVTAYDALTRLPLGLWRWQTSDGFSVLSFHPDILERVVPKLALADDDRSAQVRWRIGDLSASEFGRWIDELSYQRAVDISRGNARWLNVASQQLRAGRDGMLARAEQLLGAELVCPLGGNYTLDAPAAGGPLEYWVSSAGSGGDQARTYRSPLMDWFRGMSGSASVLEDRLVLQAEILMDASDAAPMLPGLPGLPLP